MIDIKRARTEFEHYLDGFDRNNEKIRLKIIHTNEVVRCAGEIAKRMDHAHFGVELLFGPDDPLIRSFVPSDRWDDIIREAIGRHSAYSVGFIEDERTLLHARLIRDADKLDNCRVKLMDDIKVLVGMDAEEVGAQPITDRVFQACMDHKSVRSAERITKMDYWISYIAYFFDINFRETFQIIREDDFVDRIIGRIPYSNPDTREKMERFRQIMNDYICSF